MGEHNLKVVKAEIEKIEEEYGLEERNARGDTLYNSIKKRS